MDVRAVSRFLFVSTCIFTFTAFSALPPLSADELNLRASHVLTGYVYRVEDFEVDVSRGKDSVYKDTSYTAKMIVNSSEKGGFRQTNVVRFSFWRLKTRPSGWTGP